MDFFDVWAKLLNKKAIGIYPKFKVIESSDLMIQGGDFYAIWVEKTKLWSKKDSDAIQLIDQEIKEIGSGAIEWYEKIFVDHEANIKECPDRYLRLVRRISKLKSEAPEAECVIQYLWDAETGMIDKWHKLCQQQMRDNYHMLDQTIIFANTDVQKEHYASFKLPYAIEKGDHSSYDILMDTLYDPPERLKYEWAVGSILVGDSKVNQKFAVFYGSAGSGKSTALNVLCREVKKKNGKVQEEGLVAGYTKTLNVKGITSNNFQFGLEAVKDGPLVIIQHDGKLDRIEDNTTLNSLVSHEPLNINVKNKSIYTTSFNSFLFLGTNDPVQITNAKSGLIRRLIDICPSGRTLPLREYNKLVKQISFEYGAIAYHCKEVYEQNKHLYDNYIPVKMLGATNEFYNFVLENYFNFKNRNGITLQEAWDLYGLYCTEANVTYKSAKRVFKEELKNYFSEFHERFDLAGDGKRVRSVYVGFKDDKFKSSFEDIPKEEPKEEKEEETWLKFEEGESIFDQIAKDYPAQYGARMVEWAKVKTTLKDIDTHQLHYVKLPLNHIVIDFDLTDENGEKNLELNLKAASKFPKTYAELSKSGKGIHLHYIYTGDPTKLSRVYEEHVEVKVFVGNASLRRKLTMCTLGLAIATIGSGLPLKGDDKVLKEDFVYTNKNIRTIILRNLNREYHADTSSSINYIYSTLENAYNDGVSYFIPKDMVQDIVTFAAHSTNQSERCLALVSKMHFCSKDMENEEKAEEVMDGGIGEGPIVIFDCEVGKNVFGICYKIRDDENNYGKHPVIKMINPSPDEVKELFSGKYRLVGHNCKSYDNDMLYAKGEYGYSPDMLYRLSYDKIHNKADKNFAEARYISYTDTYDYPVKKQSLKKWECELDFEHKEMDLNWDEDIPEEKWEQLMDYCANDVLATERVFNATQGDFKARCIQADISGMTPNDSTNANTTRIIFGKERRPGLTYTNLATGDQYGPEYGVVPLDGTNEAFGYLHDPRRAADSGYRFVKSDKDICNAWPGYEFKVIPKEEGGDGKAHNMYLGTDLGFGGYVYAEPGMWTNVALLDVKSMHPHSMKAMKIFGNRTDKLVDLIEARIAIKEGNDEKARKLFDGKMARYLDNEEDRDSLQLALKIAINSVYGLTSAKFDNPFRDERNRNNIVALRGALFMRGLQEEVQKRGFIVAHIKTDSIKIPDATPEIISFCMEYAKKYGYEFDHEATYDRMCLVNDAVYIAKYKDPDECQKMYGYIPKNCRKYPNQWTATGTQFAVPYVFKTLFSKEPLKFNDFCETKSVTTTLYLDVNEQLPDVTWWEELKKWREQMANGKKLTLKAQGRVMENEHLSDEEIDAEIAKGHNYIFVGKVGKFCPVKPGKNGGLLMREKDGKYYAATGSKGYRWMESNVLKELDYIDIIDKGYYDKLVDDAALAITLYCDLDWFTRDDPNTPLPEYVDGKPVYTEEQLYLGGTTNG